MVPRSKHVTPYIPFDPDDPSQNRRKRSSKRGVSYESHQAHYAFMLYATFGSKERTLERVLERLVAEGKLGPHSLDAVRRWSSRYNWQERVKEYDARQLEAQREEWEEERVAMNERTALAAKDAYLEVARLLLARVRTGKFGSETGVQLMKVAADIEYRARNDLLAQRDQNKSGLGISISIQTRVDDQDISVLEASRPQRRLNAATPLAEEMEMIEGVLVEETPGDSSR